MRVEDAFEALLPCEWRMPLRHCCHARRGGCLRGPAAVRVEDAFEALLPHLQRQYGPAQSEVRLLCVDLVRLLHRRQQVQLETRLVTHLVDVVLRRNADHGVFSW